MKSLLVILALAALLWWLRDRRTPEQKLADAIRDKDAAHLDANLPLLDEAEMQDVIDRVVFEQDEEVRNGGPEEDFDQARFTRYELEERQAKLLRSQEP